MSFELTSTTTNASLADHLCATVGSPSSLFVSPSEIEIVYLYFELPECVYGWKEMTDLVLTNIIVRGNTSHPDPLVRLALLGSFSNFELEKVRLINPTVPSGNNFAFTPNWSAVMNQLTHVQRLAVINANLQGALPAKMPSTVSFLRLSSNALSGTFPSTWVLGANISTTYVVIDLSDNKLEGAFPSNVFNASLRTCTIKLNDNKLTSLPSNVNTDCETSSLLASNNSIVGTISSALFAGANPNTKTLELDFTGNKLSGTIPSNFIAPVTMGNSTLESLFLSFGGNSFTGQLPNIWTSIVSGARLLQIDFDFSNNKLTGSLDVVPLLPPFDSGAYYWISAIQWQLGFNKLNGTIPADFYHEVPQMSVFLANLSNNAISGTLPDVMNKTVSYFQLDLANNQLTGTIPVDWLLIGQPENFHLDLSDNALTGSIPSNFLDLLENNVGNAYFNASYNKLGGPLPTTLRGRAKTSTISLSSNQFVGDLNSSALFTPLIDGASSFQFDAANNSLTGTLNIPDVAETFYAPVIINLASNQLESLVVDENANYIFAINVSDNAALTGTIPAHWFNVSGLYAFGASHTSLTGTFPREVNDEVPLQALDLSHTSIVFCYEGHVPWTTASNLVYCNLQQTGASNCSADYPAVCTPAPPTAPTVAPSAPSASPRAPSKAPTSGSTRKSVTTVLLASVAITAMTLFM